MDGTSGKQTQKKETKEVVYTRREMEIMATTRQQWRSLVGGLCSQRANRHKNKCACVSCMST